MITNMKKTYKNLQDKYINMTFSIKRKERDDLLNQAKLLKKQKMERNAHLNQQKNYSKIFSKKTKVKEEELNNISEIKYPNVNTSPNKLNNKNKKLENDFKNSNDIVLPDINMNNPENIDNNNNNKDSLINEDKGKLEEINEMMKQVIDNEN